MAGAKSCHGGVAKRIGPCRITQSVTQSVNQSVTRSVTQPFRQLLSQLLSHSLNHSVSHSISHSPVSRLVSKASLSKDEMLANSDGIVPVIEQSKLRRHVSYSIQYRLTSTSCTWCTSRRNKSSGEIYDKAARVDTFNPLLN